MESDCVKDSARCENTSLGIFPISPAILENSEQSTPAARFVGTDPRALNRGSCGPGHFPKAPSGGAHHAKATQRRSRIRRKVTQIPGQLVPFVPRMGSDQHGSREKNSRVRKSAAKGEHIHGALESRSRSTSPP